MNQLSEENTNRPLKKTKNKKKTHTQFVTALKKYWVLILGTWEKQDSILTALMEVLLLKPKGVDPVFTERLEDLEIGNCIISNTSIRPTYKQPQSTADVWAKWSQQSCIICRKWRCRNPFSGWFIWSNINRWLKRDLKSMCTGELITDPILPLGLDTITPPQVSVISEHEWPTILQSKRIQLF